MSLLYPTFGGYKASEVDVEKSCEEIYGFCTLKLFTGEVKLFLRIALRLNPVELHCYYISTWVAWLNLRRQTWNVYFLMQRPCRYIFMAWLKLSWVLPPRLNSSSGAQSTCHRKSTQNSQIYLFCLRRQSPVNIIILQANKQSFGCR